MSYGDPNQNPFSSGSYSPNPYQSPGYPGYSPSPQPAPPVLAIVSLVTGILSLFTACCCGLLGLPIPMVAIVTGGIALAQPNGQGKGMAIAGIICGGISILLCIGMIILVLANPEFLRNLDRR